MTLVIDGVEVATGTGSFPQLFSAGNGKIVVGKGKSQRDDFHSGCFKLGLGSK